MRSGLEPAAQETGPGKRPKEAYSGHLKMDRQMIACKLMSQGTFGWKVRAHQPQAMEETTMKAGIKGHVLMLCLGLLALAGCAPATQPPASQMALAQDAVEKASAASAYEYAPVELKAARDKIDQAKTAMQSKDYASSQRLLEQAEVDARLAEARSNAAKAQRAVEELQKSIDLLREEIQRKEAQ
jgi:hypothetical protein